MSSSLNLELNPFERSFAEKPKVSSSSSSMASLSMRQSTKPVLNPKLGNSDSHPGQQAGTSSSYTSLNQLTNSGNTNSLSSNLSPPVITLSSNNLTPGGSRRLPLPLSPNGVLNGSLTGLSFTPGGFLSGLVNSSSNNAPSHPPDINSNNNNSGTGMNMNLNSIGSLNNLKTGFTPNESSVRTSSGLTPAWIAATSSSSSIFTPGFNSILGISSNNSNNNNNNNNSNNNNGILLNNEDPKPILANASKDSVLSNNSNKSSIASVTESFRTNSKPTNSSVANMIPNNVVKSEFSSVIPSLSMTDPNSIASNGVNKNDNSVNSLPIFFPTNGSTSSNNVVTSNSSIIADNQANKNNSRKRSIQADEKSSDIKQRKVSEYSQKVSKKSNTNCSFSNADPSMLKLETSKSQILHSLNESDSLDSKTTSENSPEKDLSEDHRTSKSKSKTAAKKGRKEMSEEEKRQSFLERNRLAASKCRQRKKQHIEKMKDDLSYYSSQYNYLSNEVANYNKAMVTIKEMLMLKSDPLINAVGSEYFNRILLLTTIQDSNSNESTNNNNNSIPIAKIPHSMILGQQGHAVGGAVPGVGVHNIANPTNTTALLGTMISNTGLNQNSANVAASNDTGNTITNRNSNGGVFQRML